MPDTKQHRNLVRWKGIVTDQDLSPYHEELGQLKRREYRSLKLKKHKTTNAWVFRSNLKHRLIFRSEEFEGVTLLVLIKILKNHKYDDVNYDKETNPDNLNKSKWKYISLTEEDDEFAEENFEEVDWEDTEGSKEVEKDTREFFNGRFITLDTYQQQAKNLKAPGIIGGPPGSGKTCLAVLILSQFAQWGLDDGDILVYVVQKSHAGLLTSVDALCKQQPLLRQVPPEQLLVITYEELICLLNPEKNLQEVGKADCLSWISRHISAEREQAKNHHLEESFWKKSYLFYEEFLVISGCEPGEYLKKESSTSTQGVTVGQKQGFFSDAAERAWLYEAYQQYQKSLDYANKENTSRTLCHFPFYKIEQKNRFKGILADEFGDMSALQLKILLQLAIDKQIFYLGDHNQITAARKSPVTLLEARLTEKKGRAPRYVELPFSYRSSVAVSQLSNLVKKLNERLSGKEVKKGYGDIQLSEAQRKNPGRVVWMTQEEFKKQPKPTPSPNWAVITLPEHVARLKEEYNTEMVFTADSIKGMEFDDVYIDGILSQPIYDELNKELSPKRNQKKKGKEPEPDEGKYRQSLNALFTACSRPRYTVTFIESDAIMKQRQALKKSITPDTGAIERLNTTISTVTPQVTQSDEEVKAGWYKRVNEAIRRGDSTDARDILVRHLGDTDFEGYLEQYSGIKNSVKPAVPAQKPLATQSTEVKAPLTPAPPKATAKAAAAKAPPPQAQAKSAPAKTSSPAVTADEQWVTYVNGVFEKLSVFNLKKLFELRGAMRYLFEYPCGEFDCLISRICSTDDTLKTMMKFLAGNTTAAQKFNGSYLCEKIKTGKNAGMEPLIFLLDTVPSLELFHKILDLNKSIYNDLHFKFSGGIDEKLKYYLNQEEQFVNNNFTELANKIIEVNPLILKDFSLELLLGHEKDKHPLIYKLSKRKDGQKLIIAILQQNPNYLPKVMEAFYTHHQEEEFGLVRSVFYYFVQSDGGSEFYLELLKNKQARLDLLNSNYFFASSVIEPDGEDNNTLFHNLLYNHKSLRVLETIFREKPEYADEVDQLVMFEPISHMVLDQNNEAEYNSFDQLCKSLYGQKVLQLIFDRNSWMYAAVTYQLLTTNFYEKSNFIAGMLPLNYLLVYPEGVAFLRKVIKVNVGMVEESILLHFFIVLKCKEEGTRFSVSSQLTATDEGNELLSLILDKNEKLKAVFYDPTRMSMAAQLESPASEMLKYLREINNLADEQWDSRVFPEESDDRKELRKFLADPKKMFTDPYEKYASFISYICAESDRTDLFISEIKTAANFTPKLLYTVLGEGKNKGLVPFFLLAKENNGMRIFEKLTQLNTKLLQEFELPKPQKYRGDLAAYNWPLHDMLCSETGRKFIITLFNHNYEANKFKGITYEQLMQRSASGLTLLYLLTDYRLNRTILAIVLAKNPKTTSKITIKDLYPNLQDNINAPLLRLACDKEGIEVAFKLFESNKRLYGALSTEMLFQTATASQQNLKIDGVSFFFYLCRYNRKFLANIANKKTSLFHAENSKKLIQALMSDEATSFLSLMADLHEGHDLLHQMVKANPGLPSKIASLYQKGTTAFFKLFFVYRDMELLSSCLHDPDFCNLITLEMWNESYMNVPLICWAWQGALKELVNPWVMWLKSYTNSIKQPGVKERFLMNAATLIGYQLLAAPAINNGSPVDLAVAGWFMEPFAEHYNVISYILGSEELITVFINQFDKITNYKKAINGEELSRPIPIGLNKGIAPLQFLLSNANGLRLLEALLKHNPDWYKQISFRAITIHGPHNDPQLANPMHKMLSTPAGVNILNNLATLNSNAYESISSSLLFGSDKNCISWLGELILGNQYFKILKCVILQNEEKIQKNPEFFLEKNWFNAKTGSHESLFFYMCHDYHVALTLLLNDYLMAQLTIPILFEAIKVQGATINCFSLLATSATGINVIGEICLVREDVRSYIAMQGLCEAIEMEDGIGIVVLLNLLKDAATGKGLIISLLEINPNLPLQLLQVIDRLIIAGVCQFNILAMLITNLSVLEHFIKADPAFAKTINSEKYLIAPTTSGSVIIDYLRAKGTDAIKNAFGLTNKISSSPQIQCTALPYSRQNIFSLPAAASELSTSTDCGALPQGDVSDLSCG